MCAVCSTSEGRSRSIYKHKGIYNFAGLLALVVGTGASLWVKLLNLGSFVTLVLSAMLFFGAYGMILLFTKEPLVCEIVTQVISKLKGLVKK